MTFADFDVWLLLIRLYVMPGASNCMGIGCILFLLAVEMVVNRSSDTANTAARTWPQSRPTAIWWRSSIPLLLKLSTATGPPSVFRLSAGAECFRTGGFVCGLGAGPAVSHGS